MARTRITLTKLYKAAAFKQQPEEAVALAKEELPLIAEEEAMDAERSDLADLMLEIAENLVSVAGRAKETARKEELLAILNEHRDMMNNAAYMSASDRTNLTNRLLTLEEGRGPCRA